MPETVHTLVVALVKATLRPELAVALRVGVVPKFWLPGLLKVIVCAAFGVTAVDADEALPVPALFVAVTVKVYGVPLVRLLTVIVQAAGPEHDPVNPPGLEVAVYVVIAAPPFDAGAVKVTLAEPLPAVALTEVGAPGTTAATAKVCATWVAAL